MDRGAWQNTVYRVTESDLTSDLTAAAAASAYI